MTWTSESLPRHDELFSKCNHTGEHTVWSSSENRGENEPVMIHIKTFYNPPLNLKALYSALCCPWNTFSATVWQLAVRGGSFPGVPDSLGMPLTMCTELFTAEAQEIHYVQFFRNVIMYKIMDFISYCWPATKAIAKLVIVNQRPCKEVGHKHYVGNIVYTACILTIRWQLLQ